jgi:hypothetical protein
MFTLSDEIINDIVGQLECGMKCYVNKSNGQMVAVINDDFFADAIDEIHANGIKQIRDNSADYIEFRVMDSRESYEVMMDFVNLILDDEIRMQLLKSLNGSSPFRNFKSKLDRFEGCRNDWFKYKKSRYIEFVKMQILDDDI